MGALDSSRTLQARTSFLTFHGSRPSGQPSNPIATIVIRSANVGSIRRAEATSVAAPRTTTTRRSSADRPRAWSIRNSTPGLRRGVSPPRGRLEPAITRGRASWPMRSSSAGGGTRRRLGGGRGQVGGVRGDDPLQFHLGRKREMHQGPLIVRRGTAIGRQHEGEAPEGGRSGVGPGEGREQGEDHRCTSVSIGPKSFRRQRHWETALTVLKTG